MHFHEGEGQDMGVRVCGRRGCVFGEGSACVWIGDVCGLESNMNQSFNSNKRYIYIHQPKHKRRCISC